MTIPSFVNDETMAALLRLQAHGRRLALLALGPEPPPVAPGVITYHLPPTATAEGFRPGAALRPDYLHRGRWLPAADDSAGGGVRVR